MKYKITITDIMYNQEVISYLYDSLGCRFDHRYKHVNNQFDYQCTIVEEDIILLFKLKYPEYIFTEVDKNVIPGTMERLYGWEIRNYKL